MNKDHIEISIVVPMYNEADNLPGNIEMIRTALKITNMPFEIIAVDDGSKDNTMGKLQAMARQDDTLRPVGYPDNSGRGRALRTGIAHARGKYILTCDADLSYDEAYLPAMYQILSLPEAPDMVIGSPYMEGGSTKNVPSRRLFISRMANLFLSRIMPGNLRTVTGILRGYKASAIQSLDLESDGKEIHLEILSKSIAAGFRHIEFPAELTGRAKGKSKFRFKATALSHILFSVFEKPSILFGVVGSLLILAGLGMGSYIIYLWQNAQLNPNRPLMTLMIIVLLAGMQVLLFGFLGSLLVSLRREIFRMQRRQGEIIQSIKKIENKDEPQIEKEDEKQRVSVD
ncbi:MAG: glycosyltransferase [candidate division Zixibacteria bacterium]